jgi:hypothetical protein
LETIKILSGNRIHLPKEFMEFWNLKEGDLVGLDSIKEKVVIIPIEVKAKKS